ncbi:MAG: hypothetical protein JO369_04260 [Paucibacter sp.]|nr:hypothetical protein [Roseateles sp.]
MTASNNRGRIVTAALLTTSLMFGCTTPALVAHRAEAVLPLNRAWVDGHVVEYVTTDISDLAMAKALGVNSVPRLADAVAAPPGRSLLERVYKFPNNEQISVFQSAPAPAGPENRDRNYSPLWRLVLVRWIRPEAVRELKSEEELLAAEERKDLVFELTGIVVNCPIVRGGDGESLRGLR